jgi:hypothetical protein
LISLIVIQAAPADITRRGTDHMDIVTISTAPAANSLLITAQVVASLGLFAVGVAGATIAFLQWRSARTKVQLDLYEKRHPVLLAARKLRQQLTVGKSDINVAVAEFEAGVADAQFLFDDNMVAYLKVFREKAYAYQDADNDLLSGSDDPAERAELMRVRRETRQWLRTQYEEMEAMFLPYLRLEQRGGIRIKRKSKTPPG